MTRARSYFKWGNWWVAASLLLAACTSPAAQAGSAGAATTRVAPFATATRPPRLASTLSVTAPVTPTATEPAPTATPDPARTAEISEMRGQAERREQEGGSWLPAKAGDRLQAGNQLRTGDESFATLTFTEGTIARVAPNTVFTVRQLAGTPQDPFTEFTLYLGKVFIILSGQGDESFEINTPLGVASVRGSFLSVWVGADGHLVVGCLETQRVCELETGLGRVELRTGQQSEIIASDWNANGAPMAAMLDVAPGLAQTLTRDQRTAWMESNPEAVLMERQDNDQDGFTIADGDCVDTDRGIFPGAYDAPRDGIDQNCDGADGLSPDADYDSVTVYRGDCNDADPNIYPGANDKPGDSIDQDCDGQDAGAVVVDADSDGLADSVDMCPSVSGHQRDLGCGSGDPDYDNLWGEADNCRAVYNPDQRDHDQDGLGDACDPDAVIEPTATQSAGPDAREREPEAPTGTTTVEGATATVVAPGPRPTRTPEPAATALPDRGPTQQAPETPPVVPIPDRDGDGVPDGSDNCRDTFNPMQIDSDGDGKGDACDNSGPSPSQPPATQVVQPTRTPEPTPAARDRDGDGILDDVDNCKQLFNPDQADGDGDGKGDVCENSGPGPTRTPESTAEPDGDDDGVPDARDNCPADRNSNQKDRDGDGLGDVCDPTPNGNSGYPGP